jgi:hypothetical protein
LDAQRTEAGALAHLFNSADAAVAPVYANHAVKSRAGVRTALNDFVTYFARWKIGGVDTGAGVPGIGGAIKAGQRSTP